MFDSGPPRPFSRSCPSCSMENDTISDASNSPPWDSHIVRSFHTSSFNTSAVTLTSSGFARINSTATGRSPTLHAHNMTILPGPLCHLVKQQCSFLSQRIVILCSWLVAAELSHRLRLDGSRTRPPLIPLREATTSLQGQASALRITGTSALGMLRHNRAGYEHAVASPVSPSC